MVIQTRTFIESKNSTGFQALQEAARILGESINFSRKGQVALRGTPQPTQPAARNRLNRHPVPVSENRSSEGIS